MSAEFTLYASGCRNFGAPSEHTYVLTSDGENFNCFGGSSGGRFVRKGTGSSKWAKMIYGDFQGKQDDQPAAGLRVRYDGVCQIASNRVLVLTQDNVDARETKGNVLATLLYGKFGFNLDKYIETVKQTGAQLLKSNPGEIQQSDIDAVLRRVADGQTPDAELDLLHADIQEQEEIKLPAITDEQRMLFQPIYNEYQNERLATFFRVSKTVDYGTEIAERAYPEALAPALLKCATRLSAAVVQRGFNDMFGISPEKLTGILPGFSPR